MFEERLPNHASERVWCRVSRENRRPDPAWLTVCWFHPLT